MTDAIRFGVQQFCQLLKQLLVKKVCQMGVDSSYLENFNINIFFICIEPELSQVLKQPVFDARALQEYIFICCQAPAGGLIDKPDT